MILLNDFDFDDQPFLAGGLELLILPAQPFVAVIEPKRGGDGIPEILYRPDKVVIIKWNSTQSNDADDHATRASRLICIRRLSGPPSSSFRLGGRYGTHTKQVRVAAAGCF